MLVVLGAPPWAPHGWVNVGLKASWEHNPNSRGCSPGPRVETGPARGGGQPGPCGAALGTPSKRRACGWAPGGHCAAASIPALGQAVGLGASPPSSHPGGASLPTHRSHGLSRQQRGWHTASAAEQRAALGSVRLAPAGGVGVPVGGTSVLSLPCPQVSSQMPRSPCTCSRSTLCWPQRSKRR